jgi:hypothetical protein
LTLIQQRETEVVTLIQQSKNLMWNIDIKTVQELKVQQDNKNNRPAQHRNKNSAKKETPVRT